MWTNSTDDELDWEVRSGLHHECSEYSPVDDIVEITKQNNSETLIKQKQNRRVLTGAAPLCVMQITHLRMLLLTAWVRKRDKK